MGTASKAAAAKVPAAPRRAPSIALRASTKAARGDVRTRDDFDWQLRSVVPLDTLPPWRAALVRGNLRLVPYLVQRHMASVPASIYIEDLCQEGYLGLWRAAQDYDPGRGVTFATYAAWWVRHMVHRYVANFAGTVRRPAWTSERRGVNERGAWLAQCAAAAGGPGSAAGAAVLARATPRQRAAAVAPLTDGHEGVSLVRGVSLDAECGAGQGGGRGGAGWADGGGAPHTLHDRLADGAPLADEALARERLLAAVHAAVARLPPRLASVVRVRFGLGGGKCGGERGGGHEHTLAATGSAHGVTRQRAQQLEREALELLRGALRRRGMGPELLEMVA